MVDKLINILSELGYSVIQQGSLGENDDYEDSFFTFWQTDSESEMYYDNVENVIIYSYDVNFYSTDVIKTYDVLSAAITKLKEHGFIITGDGYDVDSDTDTHTARGVEVTYIKKV